MKKIIVIVLLSLFFSGNVFSQEGASVGLVKAKCSKVFELKDTMNPKIMDEWVGLVSQGYITGINAMYYASQKKKKNVAYDSADFITAYVYNECKKNKSLEIQEILNTYYRKLPHCDNC